MSTDMEIMEELRASAQKVLQNELLPKVEESESKAEFARDVHRSLGQLGLAGPMLPEAYGGADSLMAQLVVAEEMGYVDNGFGLSSLASTCLYGANVARHGTEAQKQKYLPSIIDGSRIGCWGLTEPEIGSDALSIKATAQKKGDGYILNGAKTFITNAPIADDFVILARLTDENGKPVGKGIDGGVAFILEKGMKGLSTGKPFKKMGHISSPTGEVFMENVEVGPELLLGEEGRAFYDMKYSLDVERVIFSGLATGLMRFCLDATLKYTMERKQFGVPIAEFQMVQDKVAQMSMWYESSRTYLYQTLHKLEAGQSVNREAAIAKLLVAEGARHVADMAVQCHGGYGYMKEYQVERALRDSKLFEIGAGTSEIQKLIIAKQTYKEFLRS
ncbi:MAG: acyl-CoA dehydrogenase family protein [Bdellovibrionaceae bacterium]|nr:acyl-CoA dehydrogenase family protein [Bdellovibrionales bacterium]MCB9083027.1 acyl-CoA dehydrogenase family protein [Pseudobdellovibrionaceae bacterium]